MAAPNGKYWIQDDIKKVHPHHKSFKALWETKWKQPCTVGVYPFMFSAVRDFEPIVEDLSQKGTKPPYDWDTYASAFFPQAEKLVREATIAEQEGNKEKASELFLRASAVYRIARFPAPRSQKQRYAWDKGKEACLKGFSLREHPVQEIQIPHTHAQSTDGKILPVYYHLPAHATATTPVPLIIIITGLDGYRTELAVWIEGWRRKGCACMVVEIPGTGDNPAAPMDPTAPERVWNSMFDWIEKQEGIDQSKKVVWAFSTGGYYAIRMAHTHASKLKGVVAQGGGCHHMFDREWLEEADHGEYPFDLAHTLCHKYGYGIDFEKFKAEASDKFSLLKDGTLDKPNCARILLVNGLEDSIFPVDDYVLAAQHGDPKDMRLIPGTAHMGEPQSFFVILRWIYKLLGINGDPVIQMMTVPFKPKF